MDMHGFSIDHCPGARYRASQRSTSLGQRDRNRTLRRDKPKVSAVRTPNCRIASFAQPRGVLGNDIKYRLNISRRAGDHTQNFTRGSLLLQRLGEFVEQPHVLDRDDGLIGESFEQLDLRRGEGAHVCTTCVQ